MQKRKISSGRWFLLFWPIDLSFLGSRTSWFIALPPILLPSYALLLPTTRYLLEVLQNTVLTINKTETYLLEPLQNIIHTKKFSASFLFVNKAISEGSDFWIIPNCPTSRTLKILNEKLVECLYTILISNKKMLICNLLEYWSQHLLRLSQTLYEVTFKLCKPILWR